MARAGFVDSSSSEDLNSEDWSEAEADSDSDDCVILETDVQANTREQEQVVDICLDNSEPESEQFLKPLFPTQMSTGDGRKNTSDTAYCEVNADADDEDSDCSDGNLGTSNTVVFCGKMAAPQRYRGAVQAGQNVIPVQKVASCYVGSSPSHVNNNFVLTPKTPKPPRSLGTVSVSLKEDLEMSSDEEEAATDVAISNEESRYVKRKYEDDLKSVKKVRKQSVAKSNHSPGKYSMFFTAEGVDQSGRGKTKRKSEWIRVKCLLCNDSKILLRKNFERHFARIHLENVEC